MIVIDKQFTLINSMINDLYTTLEKHDEKEDSDFSFLRLGVLIWKHNVYNKSSKVLMKVAKGLFKSYLKSIKTEIMLAKTPNSQESMENQKE